MSTDVFVDLIVLSLADRIVYGWRHDTTAMRRRPLFVWSQIERWHVSLALSNVMNTTLLKSFIKFLKIRTYPNTLVVAISRLNIV